MKIYPPATLFQEVYNPYTIYCIGDYCSDENGTYYELITNGRFMNSMLPEQLDMMIVEGIVEEIPCKPERTTAKCWKFFDCTTNRWRKPRLAQEKKVMYIVGNIIEQLKEETR